MAIRKEITEPFAAADARMQLIDNTSDWTWGDKLMLVAYTLEVLQNGSDSETEALMHLIREEGGSTAIQDELIILGQHLSKERSGELLERVRNVSSVK